LTSSWLAQTKPQRHGFVKSFFYFKLVGSNFPTTLWEFEDFFDFKLVPAALKPNWRKYISADSASASREFAYT